TPSSVRGAAGAEARAQLSPLGTAAGRGALLRQEAIAAREDGESPESPDEALEKGSRQPEAERGPGRSWRGAGGAQGATRGDSSSKPGMSPGKGGSEGDSQRSPGTEKPPELPKAAPEHAESRRDEVCPWESREQGRSVRGEICPWDTEGARLEQGSPKSGAGVGLAGKSPALPKSSSQRAGSSEGKKASICPWELGDEPRPNAEICPWEEAAALSGNERLRKDTRGTSRGEEVGSGAEEKGKQPPGK
ncbi:GP179 protein, partial [Spelaeornis formosus]|nr:GP179 protein [Elachura formosa]